MLMQVEQGVKKLFVMLLLDPVEHSSDLDPWPWGGESIYRNDEFCGTVGILNINILRLYQNLLTPNRSLHKKSLKFHAHR